jgi:hypothetical protein
MDRANPLYPSSSECLISLYDLQYPGTAESLHREREAWQQEQADIEALDENHFVLIVRPGGAWRLIR